MRLGALHAQVTPVADAPSPARLTKMGNPSGSLDYFALGHDRQATWGGEAFVSWKPLAPRVALVGGDPIGSTVDWNEAIGATVDAAHRQHRSVAVLACGAQAAEAWKAQGFKQLYLGDEAVLDLSTFSLAGSGMKSVRNSAGRVARAGYSLKVERSRDVPPERARQMQELSDRWLAGQPERGFTMSLGRLFDPRDPEAILAYAVDAHDQVEGFIQFVPWGKDGVSLDIMRRDRNGQNGLNDFLISGAAKALAEQGMKRMSLNFATQRQLLVDKTAHSSPLRRALRWALLKAKVDSLSRFNEKFRPDWVPRYVMLENAVAAVPAAIAVARLRQF